MHKYNYICTHTHTHTHTHTLTTYMPLPYTVPDQIHNHEILEHIHTFKSVDSQPLSVHVCTHAHFLQNEDTE